MKTVEVSVDYVVYTNKNTYDCDYISISCPYKHIKVEYFRYELEDSSFIDTLSKYEEAYMFKDKYSSIFSEPKYYTLKITDEDYNFIFQDYLNYTQEEREADIGRLFTLLALKRIEVYNDVDQYKKYCDNIDMDGSIDGCTFCKYYHKNEYCTKFNTLEHIKNCCFYIFNKDVDK